MKLRPPPPFGDLLAAIDRALGGARDLLPLLAGALVAWWLYVPVHELLHAAGCVAAGGEVTRLELASAYGGRVLARRVPWIVAVDGAYAGRLAGFDTHGSDLVYAVTDLAPFVLALFPGVWGLRRAAARGSAFLVGAATPFALAPWLSLTGDAYELGSLAVTRVGPFAATAVRGVVRGDDLGLAIERVAGGPSAAVAGVALSALLGVAWAWATSAGAARLAGALGERSPAERPPDAAPDS